MVGDAGEIDLAELLRVARSSAIRHLSLSGGHEVDDVTQDAIIEYRRYAETHTIDNPAALVSLIAKRRAWKYRNRWERGRRNPPILAETPPPAPGRGPVRPADEAELAVGQVDLIAVAGGRAVAEWAISQLTAQEGEIATLAYLSDPPLNGPQIAEQLGLSPGTVRNKLVKIRRQLKELLDDE